MKIVIGGQLLKTEIANYIKEHAPEIEVDIKSDLEAAFAIKNNDYDLYLGACCTGGGGALAMAISILGIDKTATIATASSRKSPDEIANDYKAGVIAFGFVESEWKYCVQTILKIIGGAQNG